MTIASPLAFRATIGNGSAAARRDWELMGSYIYDSGWELERRRLEALCILYDPGTTELLTKLAPRPGWRCLEVGAGLGTIAHWLAERVGRDPGVVATDLDTRFLEAARHSGVAVRRHDIVHDALAPETFDLIHARLVLMHIAERERALDNLVAALRPGGTLLLEDFIMVPGAMVTFPETPHAAKIIEAFAAAFTAVGADPIYGIKLPHAFRRRGFDQVSFEVRTPIAYSGSPSMDFGILSMEQLRPYLLQSGAVTAAELDEALAACKRPGAVSLATTMAACWATRDSLQ